VLFALLLNWTWHFALAKSLQRELVREEKRQAERERERERKGRVNTRNKKDNTSAMSWPDPNLRYRAAKQEAAADVHVVASVRPYPWTRPHSWVWVRLSLWADEPTNRQTDGTRRDTAHSVSATRIIKVSSLWGCCRHPESEPELELEPEPDSCQQDEKDTAVRLWNYLLAQMQKQL